MLMMGLAYPLLSAENSMTVLNLDGKVRTKGAPLAGTRVVIMGHDGPANVLRTGVEHFQHALPLQTAFLFSFEREGCVTKQLYFDTHVPPGAMASAPFDFPFQVTLEAPPKGQEFEYRGPVGYVRFYEERGDFGYDTDYSKLADPILAERMRDLTIELAPVPPPSSLMTQSVRIDSPEREDVDDFNILVPTMASRPVRVHPTGIATFDHPLSTPTVKIVSARPSIDVPPSRAPSLALASLGVSKAPLHTTGAAPPSGHSVPTSMVPTADRSEELIVEKRRVIKIVRIRSGDNTTEYRRVQHQFGQVFYFKNGESCTQWLYDQETMN